MRFKDTLLTVVSLVVFAALCLIGLWWYLVQGLNGEVIVHPTEIQERILSNRGKLIIEITPIEEAMWGGDNRHETEYFYQPPDAGHREPMGKGEEGRHPVPRTQILGERVVVVQKQTLFMRSSEGAWQTLYWAPYRFPGRESQLARSVLDRHPTHGGLFEITDVDLSLGELSVEYRVSNEIYTFEYTIRGDNSGVNLKDVIMKKPLNIDLDAIESGEDSLQSL